MIQKHLVLLLVAVATSSRAEDAFARQRASGMRAVASVEKQRESVRRQLGSAADSFFASPWLEPIVPPADSAALLDADCDALPEDRLRDIVGRAAEREGVNPILIRAVIRRESAARPCAVSVKGAQGLMQLMPATQQYLGVADPFNPAENIAGGARYLKEMLGRYKGDVRLALAAYNAGPQRVESDVPHIAETRSYVDAIMADLNKTKENQP